MSVQLDGFGLSPQQHHLFARQQDRPHWPCWSHCALVCPRDLDAGRLGIALNALLERHEILHTSFQALESMAMPLQVIEEIAPIAEIPQLPAFPAGQACDRASLRQFFRTWPATPPNLLASSGLQVRLLPWEESQLLVLALPAPCTDAATWQLLGRELGLLYAAAADELPEEPMQYADFAEWQHELLEEEETESGRAYWETQPQKFVPLQLPFTLQDSLGLGNKPECLTKTLQLDTIPELNRLTQDPAISLRGICLAAWELLLAGLSGAETFHLALTLDGRKYAELAEVAGPIAKLAPYPVEIKDGVSFRDRLQAVEQKLQELEGYQEYLAPGTELPQIGFGYAEWLAGESPTWRPLLQTTDPEPLALQLHCDRHEDGLHLEWLYDERKFTAAGIAQIAELYVAFLNAAVADPERALAQLSIPGKLPTQPELTSPVPFETVTAWLAAQATRTPDRPAVVDLTQTLTYAELDRRANQIANHLQSLGIGFEDRVVLYGDRSVDLIVAIVGILKAGAAYVPIDAGTPAPALQQRLDLVTPKLAITTTAYLDRLPTEMPTLCCDRDGALLDEQPTTAPAVAPTSENLAYIIFTSGSTGKPKGVAIEHRQLAHYIHSISQHIECPEAGRWALASTLAADLGHTIVFPCLCSGHSLHLLAPERCLDEVAFAEDMAKWQIDVLKIVPAHLRGLLAGDRAVLPRWQLISGGEALDWPLVDRIRELGNCKILNHYGPTETTVGALVWGDADIDGPRDTATVPVGRPLAHARAYILDNDLQPLPPGVPGLLYIGGAGVARGYWQRADLTDAVFIDDPFSDTPSARLYATGDRARYRYDGAIEFLGRQDNQVKVRGFRVELGAIEAALLAETNVREAAVVLATPEGNGHGQLIAYIVPEADTECSTDDLQAALKARLPEQMVPTAIASLDVLPRLANGKCDRRNLAARPLPVAAAAYEPPRNESERILAQLWQEVLGRDAIGIHDNFFALGGDSILCIQMVGRATPLGLRFTPKQLFDCPTIAELATVVETATAITAEQGLVSGPVLLTPIQEWFFAQDNPDRHHWNQAVFLQSAEPLNISTLTAALQAILAHHDSLRSQYRQTPNGWQQEVAAEVPEPAVSVFDLSALSPDAQQQALKSGTAELQTGLNLTDGPLLRAGIFVLGPQQPEYLFLVCHHLAIDGVSWPILLTDLLAAYQQCQAGRAPALPPKTTSFQAWSTQLQDYAQSETLRRELDYWQAQLQAPCPPLPQDFPKCERDLSHQCSLECALSADLTQELLQEVPVVYQTQIDDLLLLALVLAVGQWTGQYQLRLDLEGYGRPDLFSDIDISRTVGWFTTLYPVALGLDAPQDLGSSIKTIKETLRQVPQQGIGYGLLRYLNPDTRPKLQALQDVAPAPIRFNYLGQGDRSLAATTTAVSAAPLETGVGRAPSSQRLYAVDIVGIVRDGQLVLQWRYSSEMFRRNTIEALAQGYLDSLERAIAHCQDPDAGGFTPSDFPDADLDGDDLDQLMAQLL
ncbi:non-ribosomal peptide synthase domain protein/amino acid adenylation domain protein [Rubidibacter lacunae KORDI 51-2]|uniref:Non-ribosomal peptide synthase domain protein/amino acid adenylation domain protein n=1 Tax=Rubidibacter lacunae KORDI 51-2 TaxID=582515 RepID=U5DML5_9CHRO|nr:non-ribosomal peptide synthetase [Rubidibacter lacunae]ERN42082.1 non-ribosomal peptide synthase domain protein/amino acid adenylation domain protein [Rubidibacter lacunae KORDI 51-2]